MVCLINIKLMNIMNIKRPPSKIALTAITCRFRLIIIGIFCPYFSKKLAHYGLHLFFIGKASYVVLTIICVLLLWMFNHFSLSKTKNAHE